MCLLWIIELLAFLVLIFILTGPVFTVFYVIFLVLMVIGIIIYAYKNSQLSETQKKNIRNNLIFYGVIAVLTVIYFVVVFSMEGKREKEDEIRAVGTRCFGAKIDLVALHLNDPSLMDSTSLARESEQEMKEFKDKVIGGKVKYGMTVSKLLDGGDTIVLDHLKYLCNEVFVPYGKMVGLLENNRIYGVKIGYGTTWVRDSIDYPQQLQDLVSRLSTKYGERRLVADTDSLYRAKWMHQGENVILDVEIKKDMCYRAELYIYLPHTFRKVYEDEDKSSPIYSYR